MMKKLLFSVLLLLMTAIGAVAQVTVTIGEGTSYQSYPLPGYYGWNYNVFLYTPTAAAALGADCDISSIAFNVSSNNTSTGAKLSIWVKDVAADYALATATTFGEYTTGATLVYESNDLSTTAGWNTFDFISDFSHEGGNALLVAVRGEGCSTSGGCSRSCYYTTATNTYWSKNQDRSDPGTDVSGNLSNNRANIQLELTYTGAVCLTPSGLATSNITHNSAELSWSENGNATAWVLQYGTDNTFASGTYTEASVNNPTTNLTGLNALTTYYVRVKPDCDTDGSHWSSSISFTTTAVATEVGDSWSDNFEGATCEWELINGTLTNAWAWGTAVNNGGTHALYVSNDNGFTNEYSDGGTMVYAQKLLNFATGKYEFTYDWMANGESTYDYLRVALVPASVTLAAGTSTPSGFSTTSLPTGWIVLDGGSKLNLVDTWQTAVNAVNVTAGNYYLVFAWRNDSGGGTQPPAAIDNVSITRITCAYDVTGLAVSNITTTAANLTWTAGEASQWQVAYSTSSDFAGATEQIVSTASCNMTSLTSASTYYVKVRAYCGGTDFGAWSSVLEFNTACDAITSYPWSENFDGYTLASTYTPSSRTLPICWNYINECTYNDYKYYPTIYYYSNTDYSHSTPNSLRLYSYYYYSSWTDYDPQPQYAILPAMENLSTKRIELWAKGYNTSSTFKIGLMTDPSDASTFVQVGEEHALTTSYQKFTVDLTGIGNYIAIMIDAANSGRTNNGVYIDDITVMEQPSCLEPTALSASNVLAREATLSWTAGASETAWQICLNNDEDNLINADSNPFTLTGLTPETNYQVKVRAKCSESDFSEWTSNISFTTTVSCPVPTALTCTGVTATTATLSWTAGAGETAWQICLDNDEEHLIEADSNPFTLEGLTAETAYTAKVRAVCGVDDVSAWTAVCNFEPTAKIIIGSGTATSNYLPTYNFYKFELTQQIYTAAEIGAAGYIHSVDFYNAGTTKTRSSLNVYLVNTDKASFANSTDWIAVTNDDLVYSGSATFTAGEWSTITFDNDFYYNGTSNIAIVVDDNTNDFSYSPHMACRVFDAQSQAMYYNNDSSNPDPTSPSVSGTITNTKNQIRLMLIPGEPPACVRPTNLTATNITARTADLSWAAGADETAWQICLNDVEDDEHLINVNGEPSYTLTGLTPEYAYTVKVRANCGGDVSAWTVNSSFTTTISCPAPTALTCTGVTATTATLSWTAGAGETAWQICLNNDEVNLIEADSNPYTLTGLTAETAYTAKVRAVCGVDDVSAWTSVCNFEPTAKIIIGSGTATSNYLPTYNYFKFELTQQIYTAAEIGAAGYIHSVDFYNAGTTKTRSSLNVYLVNTDKASFANNTDWITVTNDDLVYSGSATFTSGEWSTITFDNDFYYDGTSNIAIVVDDNTNDFSSSPYMACRVFDAQSQAMYYYNDNSNPDPTSPSVSGTVSNTKNQIRLMLIPGEPPSCVKPSSLTVTNVTARTANISWTAGADETAWQICLDNDEENIIDVDAASYAFEGLTPENTYNVKVRSVCGTSDYSDWTSNISFTTLISCPVPTALAATLTPGDGSVATLTWTENGTATAWTLEYGTAADFAGATSVDVNGTPSAALTGLTAETPYYARVKTVCGVDDESAWSSVINFTPTDAYSITLNDGTTTNNYVPVYGLYVDDHSRSQFIIPASALTTLQWGTINKLTFYSSNTSVNWGAAQFDVRLKEVNNTTFENSTLEDWNNMSLVYNGSLTISDNIMEITFSTPYTYMGGNLMIGTNCIVNGTYASCSWYGVSADGASLGGYNTTISQRNFLPKVTIKYILGAPAHTITASTGENGTIAPNGETSVNDGESQPFTITPDECYHIASVLVDDVEAINDVVDGVYTFTNVTADHTITATFALNTYTITATAGENGTITETSPVNCGENMEITITPANCYHIASVLVDDVEAINDVVDGIYTFANVTANHTIAATFAINTYNITATAGEGGSVTETSAVNCGANKEITITANEGYRIASVIVDETENVTEAVIAAEGVYTFENVTADHTIAATFERVHTISAGTGADGSITPEGIISVLDGESQTFTITPVNECFRIGQVMVDGVDVTDEVIANNGVYTFENVTENHNIVANFDAITLTITATAGAGGTIAHNADYEAIPCASNESYTIVANDGYRIVSVIVDDEFDVTNEVIANNGVYTFTNVRANHTIAATFGLIPANTYTITATAGENGTITPNGEVVVYEGDSQNFTIVAAAGYRIASVMVDSETEVVAQLVDGVYTFENVTADHTINATFEVIPTYTITATAGENGTITPDGEVEVAEGAEQAFAIVANEGYRIASVMVDETENVTEQLVEGVYTFTNVAANHTIAATFEAIPVPTYTITATAGENGSINPEGEVTVNEGENKEFTIVANEGYRIASVMVDETEDVTEELVEGVYTFANVTANHTIAATFEEIPVNTYTITLTVGEHGSVTPSGENGIVTVTEGEDITFTITPDEGYLIGGLIVDGSPVYCDVEGDVVNFYDVDENHTIEVVFTEISATNYTITATAGENGTIDPESAEVTYGTDKMFTITPDAGYRIATVVVDAETEGEANVTYDVVAGDGVFFYTFTNVTANHTIHATFELIPTYTITVEAGDHGNVYYNDALVSAPIVVNEGATPEFEITPETGYQIDVLTVGGNTVELTEQQLGGFTYTFEPVRADITLTVTFVETVAVDMIEAGSMSIYPNPNNGMFSIDFSNIEGDATYQIIDARGAVVETRDINVMNGETMNFNHDLRPGAYFVRIINGDKVYVEQIVVE